VPGRSRGRLAAAGWRSRQRRLPGGAIESEQAVRVPGPVVERSEAGALALGRSYWLELRALSLGLVRAREQRQGIELAVLGAGPPLLRFGAPLLALEQDRVACSYPIRGGLLARRAGGALTFSQTGAGPCELAVRVSGFHPLLAPGAGPPGSGLLYGQLEERLHVALSRRYLLRLGERR
jgi:hypothetical protein